MEIKVNLPLKMPILMWGVWVHQHSTLAIQDKCKRTKEVWEQFGIEISAQSQVKGLKVLLLAQWGSDWCGPRGVEHGSAVSQTSSCEKQAEPCQDLLSVPHLHCADCILSRSVQLYVKCWLGQISGLSYNPNCAWKLLVGVLMPCFIHHLNVFRTV